MGKPYACPYHTISFQTLSSVAEYEVIASLFGVGKSTVWRCFKMFIYACNETLVHELIKWPTLDGFKKIGHEFEMRWNHPMAIGALDGSHIKIQVPEEEKTAYINYNNSYFDAHGNLQCELRVLFLLLWHIRQE